ncbi:acyl-CoA carboxylase epsilon subunit [Streptomyces sp. NPDC001027]|uniref:acyl-CoA carboxylase epsilon subunit n=1 Tax=Streptomyces sp. NPDC001027 TaxID=3154771 RepID=UPI00331A398B
MTGDPLFTIRSGRPTEQEIAALTVALLTRLHRSAADPSAVADWAQRTPDVPAVAGLAEWPGPDRPATTVWGRRSGSAARASGSGWGNPSAADAPPETGWGSAFGPQAPGPEQPGTAGWPELP